MKEDKLGYGGATKKYLSPLLPFFKVIYYKKGNYKIIDRYSGDENFIGETVYYLNKKPVYGLNYYGMVTDNKLKTKKVYAFLKRVLISGSSKYRGQNGYKEGKWLYRNSYNENHGLIEGKEKIYHNKRVVYLLLYHGGRISEHKTLKSFNKNLLPLRNIWK